MYKMMHLLTIFFNCLFPPSCVYFPVVFHPRNLRGCKNRCQRTSTFIPGPLSFCNAERWTILEWTDLSPPYQWQISLTFSDIRQSVNKACGRVVFENDSRPLWGCTKRTVRTNSRDVVYFACVSGWSDLSQGERSIVLLSNRAEKIKSGMLRYMFLT